MTLRTTIEIVPHGREEDKRGIFRLDIHNMGMVRDEGFGHQVCSYRVDVYGMTLPIPGQSKGGEWEHYHTDFIQEFDRRNGAVALIGKAAELVEDNC